MRKLILLLGLMLFVPRMAFGQSTTVSGNVTDSASQAWLSGTYEFDFVPNPLYPNLPQYTWTGGTLTYVFSGSLDGSGNYSVSLPSNTAITPNGSTWTLKVCPLATAPCYTTRTNVITGSTQTLNVTPPAISINISQALSPARAYSDTEITGASLGSFYYNITSSVQRVCTTGTALTCSGWVNGGGGGGGTVTTSGTVTTNYFALFSGATSISNAPCDNGVTNAGDITCTQPLVIAGAAHGITIAAGTPVSGASGVVVYGSDATNGYAEVNENNTGLSRVCTAANAVCPSAASGMTSGQVGIAGSASTFTSSKAIQGTDTNLLSSGTVSGSSGVSLCTDSSGGATTTGCPAGSSFAGTVIYTGAQTAGTGDNGKLVIMNCTAACAYTLPATQPSTTWQIFFMSVGSHLATITLGGSDTYNGTATSPTIAYSYQPFLIAANTATSTDYRGGAPINTSVGLTITPSSNQTIWNANTNGNSASTSATNFNANITNQSIGSIPQATGGTFFVYVGQATAGVGCSAASNTAAVTISFTDPAGNAQSITGPTLTISGNGTVGASSGSFATGTYGFAASASTPHFSVTGTLASTGCSTTPQYVAYVGFVS